MKQELLYLSREDVVATALPMSEIITTVEAAFREHGEGRVEMPPKPGVHPLPDAFLHAMPAFIPAMQSVGVKWVSGFPSNIQRGLPYISGLLILNDPETGFPIAVMDCTWITAKRTGAATAVSAKYLARPASSILGILGCGVQGRSNLEALSCLFPIKKVLAYDTAPTSAQAFAQEAAAHYGYQVTVAETPQAAVRGCDMVVTAGPILKTPHASIKAGWLEQGAFASLVDFDSYWDPAALAEFDLFTTDDLPQFLHYQEAGYFQHTPPISATLGELVTGKKPGRKTPSERTAACNLGLALCDMATAPLIYQRAKAAGLGTWLPL
jgi:ornithine cyclodeaminase/alanine dehydrogenase-like protein (mu-crystallin family)